MKPCFLILLFSLLALTMSGCAQFSFYSQSVLGHSKLMSKRKPVAAVLQQTSDEALKQQLELSQEALEFAANELGLPRTKSYRSYVELERDFPVWNVVAADEFSLQAEQWCYLVIGCASYRGYFAFERAQRYADKLEEKGLETHVSGAIAYSTLGWFRDPLLSSMFRYGNLYLVETLFHELAHQQLYLANWSGLNEGFATVVASEGMRRWLMQRPVEELQEFKNGKIADEDFSALIDRLRESLKAIYDGDQDVSHKRIEKTKAFERFKDDYRILKDKKWSGRGWYDGWMSRPLNNARLVGYSNYQEFVPELEQLLKTCNNDLPLFYEAIAKLEQKKKENLTSKDLPKNCH